MQSKKNTAPFKANTESFDCNFINFFKILFLIHEDVYALMEVKLADEEYTKLSNVSMLILLPCLISIVEIAIVDIGQYEKVSPASRCYPILSFLRTEINQKLDAEYTDMEALSCENQLVAGTNYKIIVRYFQGIFCSLLNIGLKKTKLLEKVMR